MAQGVMGVAVRSLAARASSRRKSAFGQWPTLTEWFFAEFQREVAQRRLFPWIAVAFGTGILIAFNATHGRPSLAAPLVVAGLTAIAALAARSNPGLRIVMVASCAVTLGFAAAVHRVDAVAGPIIARTTVAKLTATVETLDEREDGVRLILRVERFGDVAQQLLPNRVRVSHRGNPVPKPGDTIVATARLLPPPEAARPGGYDFARDAYFRGIGGVGSLVGKVEIRPQDAELPLRMRLLAAIDSARNALTRRIAEANGGQAGAVAAALVTGKRGLIAPETNEILRSAGIYHVVSISGLHMVLAAGVVFWLVRAILALVPNLALSCPIKKMSGGVAMVGVTAYCAFSGWDIAAERALIMTLVMLGAILVDRPALSMRNLAIAAMIALAREPEALLGPSFQMSFGAVAGLIACAPFLERHFFENDRQGPLGRAVSFIVTATIATLATTLVAQIATAPFSTYHFQSVQPFGLIGNALTLPLVSLAVMPAAVIGIIAYPFALDQPIWWLMGQAVGGMLAISSWISEFGQSTVLVPAFGSGALALLSIALLFSTLPVSGLRWLALLPGGIGAVLAATPIRQDIFVDREGKGAAVRGLDGHLAILGRPSHFVIEQWLKADGDRRKPGDLAAQGLQRCDKVGCTIRSIDGRWVALSLDRRAEAEDCARAEIIISPLGLTPNCTAKLKIDRWFLSAHGAVAIRLGRSKIAPTEATITSVRHPNQPHFWASAQPNASAPSSTTITHKQNANARPSPDGIQSVDEPVSSGEQD